MIEHFDFNLQETWPFESRIRQSPIAVETSNIIQDDTLGVISPVYSGVAWNVVDTGMSIQASISGAALINHRLFEAQQVHFHAPAEHTIDGVQHAGELHIVHRRRVGSFAVMAIFFEVGPKNDEFEKLLTNIEQENRFSFDLTALLPDDLNYYHYLGSLTTPPLSENVEWYILPKTMTLSEAQLARFHDIYPRNNRNLQPDNDRIIVTPGK
ncbi:carbonic anhydrase family protein [Weissella soli]|uniref:carbonic anhydrase family protein n=1 Tax=Weissella soli TaxID=155866 RepID=UPI003C72A36E